MKTVPKRSDRIFVSQKMLASVKSELKSDIASVSLELKSVRSEVGALRLGMNSRFEKMDSKIEKVIAAIHRTNALVEEQNSRNRVVLDGYDQIYRRQEEYEERLKNLEG